MADVVLVTGGTGFIGRAVASALRASGRIVVALGSRDGDIAAPATLESHRDARITSVVHCAGRTFVPDSWKYPADFIAANVLGTARVLDFCRETGARLVHISAYVYGQPAALPIKETAPVRPDNPYAESKYLAEELCRFYAANCSVPVTIIRPFNVYGSRQPPQFLIPTIIGKIRAREAIEVLDLGPRRDYVFLPDLVDAILRAEARRSSACEIFNVGSGVSHSVAEIIAAAQSAAGTELAIVSSNVVRNAEISDVVADIGAARAALNWSPRHDLMQGLRILLAETDAGVPNDMMPQANGVTTNIV